MADVSVEMSVRELRDTLADALHEAAVHGRITYVTNRGRRLAAVVPLAVAEQEECARVTPPVPAAAPGAPPGVPGQRTMPG
jgi:antitoxin (DNA-binding transcriptional repressor) of toxin-antitoxin stability system